MRQRQSPGPVRRGMGRVVTQVGAGLDATAMRAAGALATARPRNRSKQRIPDAPAVRVRLLGRVERTYDAAAPDFHPETRRITPRSRFVRRMPEGGSLLELRWPSDRSTWLDELADLLRDPRNDLAAARLWTHATPRRTVVLVHGYMAGQWAAEQRLWAIDRMYRNGWDVALFILPYHGVRADPRRIAAPRFPSRDPRRTNESFRHAVADLRDLVSWLRARGAPSVGLMGMSLGGYTVSLTATVEPDLDFLVPVIPLASIADFALARGHLGRGSSATDQHAALDRAHRVVCPLSREPLVAPERTFVVAAAGDRITPIHHAERLAEHFGSEMHVWPGSHLLQVGRDAAYRRVERFLEGLT